MTGILRGRDTHARQALALVGSDAVFSIARPTFKLSA